MKKTSFILLGLTGSLLLLGCGPTDTDASSDSGEKTSEESLTPPDIPSSSSPLDLTGKQIIRFEVDGGTEVADIIVNTGEVAVKPADPRKDGFLFSGWYTEKELKNEFDWSQDITSDWTLFAKWVDEDYVAPTPEPATIYFRDASWWSASSSFTYAKFGNDEESDYGAAMEKVRFCNDQYKGVGYNYWKIDIPDVNLAKTITFFRMGQDNGITAYWNAYTVTVDLAERGENNLYDIKAAVESWEQAVTGAWGIYDPNDKGNEDAPEPPAELDYGNYLAGSFNGWVPTKGYKFTEDDGVYTLSGIDLHIGDEFKIHDTRGDGNTWYGYDKLSGDCELKGKELVGVGDGNIIVQAIGKYSFTLVNGTIDATFVPADLPTYVLSSGERTVELTYTKLGAEGGLSLSAGAEFIVKNEDDGTALGYSDLSDAYDFASEGANNAIKLDKAGYVKVVVNDGEISLAYYEEEPLTIYFRDATWWNKDGAAVSITFDDETGLGRLMDKNYYDDSTSLWSYEIVDPSEASTVTFHRVNDDGSADWGAATAPIALEDRGDNLVYDISASTPAWTGDGAYAVGVWTTLDSAPEDPDLGDEDPTPDYTYYLIGQGSFLTGEEAWATGSALPFEPHAENEVKLLGVELAPGDVFKIHQPANNVWAGYSELKDGEGSAKSNFEAGDTDNIVVKIAGTYDFYFDFTALSSQGHSIWVSLTPEAAL